MENLFDEWFDDLNLPEQTIRDIACAAYWKGRGDQSREQPNRDAPAKATMHPDLEWLAKLPSENLEEPRKHVGKVYFYRYSDQGGYYEDRVGVAIGRSNVPEHQYGFTLSEIEQARRHLAKVDRHGDAATSGPTEFKRRLEGMTTTEAWFKEHGNSTTKQGGDGSLQQISEPATVHELYTHFRARLLDELRQAGILGDDRE